ncbi:MAG: hypothetical protein A2087_05740 [Spirochaetes bacterium GWD1_61_31]|nr:MAG: hypothetical protein A2Y37_13600 [Spirochaetes bacterium GWB1_60_80]OHD31504.1 MAG: hypothetical protein A2004_13225 [Spirochaetes bacterium GWC1_61_12]OHD43281.1 MAG: hypothetical protein A2087_05740 [Spirochaetes bacterium GWD1_61_31]OHD45629.1 MAG: hypothetical protein A2Y35_09250 [Spirochaetes bacterium GWE1_60_18]OHD60480.1 MAG: hypothetical protein A2Y32_02940 [Spirochaetes bacterium GWF1_60_12]HAP44719.1 hypothetical protein [Spirochaetaceae bacterium]
MKFALGRFSVTRRIFLSLMALFALVVASIGITIYFTLARSIETAVLGNITRDMAIAGRDFGNWLAVKTGRLEVLRSAVLRFRDDPSTLQTILNDAVRGDAETPFVYFGSVARGKGAVVEAPGVTRMGQGYFVDGSGWLPEADFNWLERPWFTPATLTDQAVVSSPYIDQGTGETVITLSLACRTAAGELVGVLAADIFLSSLHQAVADRRFSAASSTWLVDQYGRFITLGDQPANTPFGRPTLFEPGSPLTALRPAMQAKETTSGLLRQSGQYFASAQVPRTGWLIVTFGPIQDVAGLVIQFYRALLIISAAAMLLAIALAIIESRHIAKPVKALAKGALALAEGDLSYRIRLDNLDEFGQLADFFNQVADSLYQDHECLEAQRAEIVRYSETLEIKVAERTLELNEANTMLRMRNDQMEEEVQMAAAVQRKIIPTEAELPVCPWLSFGARYQAMANVGGDLYDVIDLGRQSYAFIIGDVSGHGVPAALIAAMAKVSFRSHLLPGRAPNLVLSEVNSEMCQLIGDETYFLSAFVAILDIPTARLTFANAGHHPALLRHVDGSVEELDIADGQLIGIAERFVCSVGSVIMTPDDKLILYTDGIIEARSRSGEYFDLSRLRSLLAEHGAARPSALVSSILEEVRMFAAGMQQSDDRAMLIVELTSLPDVDCPVCDDNEGSIEEASRLEAEGQLASAAGVLEDLRRRRPEDTVVMNRLAGLRRRLGDLAGAERLLRTAICMMPENADYRENLQTILAAQRD